MGGRSEVKLVFRAAAPAVSELFLVPLLMVLPAEQVHVCEDRSNAAGVCAASYTLIVCNRGPAHGLPDSAPDIRDRDRLLQLPALRERPRRRVQYRQSCHETSKDS